MAATRLPRRVVLTAVPRRDAAQRLSLAFCLLAREKRTRPLALPPGQPSRDPVDRELAASRSLIQEAIPPCQR
jgi:hypothetical protein